MAETPNGIEQQVEDLILASFAQEGNEQQETTAQDETGEKRIIDVDLYRLENGAVLLVPGNAANPLDTNAVWGLCHVWYSFLLIGCWLKGSVLLVEENIRAVCYMDNQVEPSVSVHVLKTERDRGQLFTSPEKRGADIHSALAGIVAWYLNDDDVLVKVLGDEMTVRVLGRSVSNIGIHLVGARSSILPVVLGHLPPVRHDIQQDRTGNQKEQDKPDPKEPVETGETSASLWSQWSSGGSWVR